MSSVASERVLVVPTRLFHELGHFQGFCAEPDHYLPSLLRSDVVSFQPRAEMETNPDFKQLIPYVLIRHTGAGGASLFQYTRGAGQGEARLRKKRSVGIGGHISHQDTFAGDGADPYLEGMRRELDEEVQISAAYTQRCAGLINDDETEVGQVHLGIVHLFDIEAPAVTPRESDIAEAGFLPISQLLDTLEQFETWSQICLEALFGSQRSA